MLEDITVICVGNKHPSTVYPNCWKLLDCRFNVHNVDEKKEEIPHFPPILQVQKDMCKKRVVKFMANSKDELSACKAAKRGSPSVRDRSSSPITNWGTHDIPLSELN